MVAPSKTIPLITVLTNHSVTHEVANAIGDVAIVTTKSVDPSDDSVSSGTIGQIGAYPAVGPPAWSRYLTRRCPLDYTLRRIRRLRPWGDIFKRPLESQSVSRRRRHVERGVPSASTRAVWYTSRPGRRSVLGCRTDLLSWVSGQPVSWRFFKVPCLGSLCSARASSSFFLVDEILPLMIASHRSRPAGSSAARRPAPAELRGRVFSTTQSSAKSATSSQPG